MPAVEDVSFELERFEWTGDDTLEVVGRWNGVRGRRMARPALTIEAGGRRHRVTGSADAEADPWRASFDWDGSRGDIAGAELELGRSLVVELPPPRRRRRRRGATAELDLRVQLDELRATVAELTAERDRLLEDARDRRPAVERDADEEDERDQPARGAGGRRGRARGGVGGARGRGPAAGGARVAAPAAARDRGARGAAQRGRRRRARTPSALRESLSAAEASSADAQHVVDELAGLRLAHGSLKAAHERLEDELEALRAVRDERDELQGELERSREDAGDEEREKAALGEVIRELQERTTLAEEARERLTGELVVAREEITRLQGAAGRARGGADRRRDRRRAARARPSAPRPPRSTSGSRTRREEAQRTIVAEAEETERLRAELERTREDAEKLLAAERAEVARLREELLTARSTRRPRSPRGGWSSASTATSTASGRRRARCAASSRRCARSRPRRGARRRCRARATGRSRRRRRPRRGRGVRTPLGTQRRVEAARVGRGARACRGSRRRTVSLWIVRVLAAGLVAALASILVHHLPGVI